MISGMYNKNNNIVGLLNDENNKKNKLKINLKLIIITKKSYNIAAPVKLFKSNAYITIMPTTPINQNVLKSQINVESQ